MALRTINIRVDEKLKEKAESLFEDFGMNTTTAINVFLRAVVRERKIPFDIAASEPFYSESNMKHLKKSIDQLNEGKGKIHDIVEVKNEETMV
ncbi:type II toxin-antitoxin system RelB/DinJ family antitoxin [Clostridium sp. WLY-B-L2]|jgi:DNA-damage-inducible protein J|uniref:Type II toxin-antitoxin system RelB/DinJ family antitoxin n=1 Tax=Clostridium aromativorans TaxID=2836848 RepID=A0ABS8N1D2_9CLOT|nr:type II toxin-antitoxin system RelB/DinJ family antitoxin [Clostridium aromativorans]MCC9293491.1 type II toxin-antitoxin system RelB/DinJ family antitoxin [Clostridium aromativorans]